MFSVLNMGCIVSPWIPLKKKMLHKQFHDDVVPGLLFIEVFVQNLLQLNLEAFQNRIDFLK